jgi:hypothetical protein
MAMIAITASISTSVKDARPVPSIFRPFRKVFIIVSDPEDIVTPPILARQEKKCTDASRGPPRVDDDNRKAAAGPATRTRRAGRAMRAKGKENTERQEASFPSL